MKKLVIVESIKTIREGFKILINRFSEHECLETFDNYEKFKNGIKKINPDVLLINLDSKNKSVIDEIRLLKNSYPNLLIIILTTNLENELLFDALLNGASAYIHKNIPTQRFVKALEEAIEGRIMISTLVARRALKHISDNNLRENHLALEINLLEKLIEGNSLHAIEKLLNISKEEIKITFNKTFEKLFENNNIKLINS